MDIQEILTEIEQDEEAFAKKHGGTTATLERLHTVSYVFIDSTVTRVQQHERIAKMWSGILNHTVTGHQVALCMVGMKLVRADNAPNVDDSYVDACGYAAIAAEIADHNRQPEQREDTAPIETIRYGG